MRPVVLLAYPKIDHEKNYVYFWMPTPLLIIAKSLLEQGLAEPIIFDGNNRSIADWRALLSEYASRAICIAVSVMTGGGQIGHAIELLRVAKELPDCPLIVLGGPHVNVLPEQTLAHEVVDVVLQGPGNISMPALVKALLGDGVLKDVPGLLAKVGCSLICGPKNQLQSQLLTGYPWQLLNLVEYFRDDPTVAQKTLNYVSSIGCVYKCRFCYETTYKYRWSHIEAIDLLNDIENLVLTYGINGIKFYDADWFISLRRAKAFVDGLSERAINIRWAASINPNDVLRARRQVPKLLDGLAASGCSRLLMGVESGSDRVLADIVKKEVTRNQIVDVAREIAAAGILGSYTFIVGFPGETTQEQDATYSLIDELDNLSPRPESRVHLFAPYPGTPLFDVSLEHGFRPPNSFEEWSNFDYYASQTPWTDDTFVERARRATRMTLMPAPITGGMES